MYFSRLTSEGATEATEPYCTICSKMALDAGVRFMVLLEREGWMVYDTEEYNDASFRFGSD